MRAALSIFAAAALVVGPSVQAQESAPTSSASENVECALFLSTVLGSMQEAGADEQALRGVASGVTYFVGRYEGAGGTDFKGAMLERFSSFTEADMARLQPICAARMKEMGELLIDVGQAITEMERARAAAQ